MREGFQQVDAEWTKVFTKDFYSTFGNGNEVSINRSMKMPARSSELEIPRSKKKKQTIKNAQEVNGEYDEVLHGPLCMLQYELASEF